MASWYLCAKCLHLLSLICWMAGMLYLPRLFVYHAQLEHGSASDQLLQTMERRLLRAIMNPAMMATCVLGGWLTWMVWDSLAGYWLLVKLGGVAGLLASHGMMAKWRTQFVQGTNPHGHGFYRMVNELQTLLLVVILVCVVLKPF